MNDLMNEMMKKEASLGELRTPYLNKRYIKAQEACGIYGLGRTKIKELAKEAGAALKVDKSFIIDTVVFDKFFETFRLRGGSF